jgi:hypothetical protein
MVNKNRAAKIIRNEPSCNAVNPTKPLFIRIKELPQIKARIIRKTHLKLVAFISVI